MARLLKIWTVLLFTLCAVLLADEGNSVQTTGRKLADGGILLPRESSYQGKGFGVGIGGGSLFPSGKKCKALAQWQGTGEYAYSQYVSAGVSVRMYGGNIDDEISIIYQRYHSHVRLHYLVNPNWVLFAEPAFGFESTSLDEIRGKNSSGTSFATEEEVNKAVGCDNEYSLDGASGAFTLGSGFALSESWSVNGAAGYEQSWSGVGQLSISLGFGFNLRNNVDYLKRNVLGAWIAFEMVARRYFSNETGDWGVANMIALILNI